MTAARQLRWWQGSLGLVLGAVASQMAGGIPLLVVFIVALNEHPLKFVEGIVQESITTFEVLGPSILLTGGTMAIVAALTPWVCRVRPVRAALGFRRAHWLTFVLAPVGILGLGPLSDALREMMQAIAPELTFGAIEGLDAMARSAPIYLILPAMALVPGFAEELLFRGMFQRSIRHRGVAVLASGLLFAMVHMDPHHVVPIIPLGLYLAWLGDRTNSVVVPMFAHMCNNAVAVLAARYLTEADVGESLPWWTIPIGLALTAGVGAAIFMVTRSARADEPELSTAAPPELSAAAVDA